MTEKEILIHLAEKYNLPEEELKYLVFSQFKFVRDIIREGNYESVRVRNFGIFAAKERRLKHLKLGKWKDTNSQQ